MKYELVLLDADNTLFDFDATEDQALRRSMEARGLEYTPERKAAYLDINRPLWAELYRGNVTQEWLTVERFRRFGKLLGCGADPAEWNREYLYNLGDCGVLLPGALELLEHLRPHCRLVLATNGVTEVQHRRLQGSPVREYLDGVFISQEMGVGKPNAAYFDKILETMGGSRETTVMVGDTLLSDIQGAVNAGLDSVWYAPGGGESELPTYTARTLAEVEKFVLGE